MNDKPTLLLFKLASISQDAEWDKPADLVCPPDCAAIAVSGGTPDLRSRVRVWRSEFVEKRDSHEHIDYPGQSEPFLFRALDWVFPRVMQGLLGSGGRLYPVFGTGRNGLVRSGLKADTPGKIDQFLASLKLGPQLADAPAGWHRDFLTCFSHGLAFGFWGDEGELEKRLREDAAVVVLLQSRDSDEFSPTQLGKVMEERARAAHPYLHANWDEHGFEWILNNSQLVVRPWGYEGMDAIFLSKCMTRDEMVGAIRRELAADAEILEFDGNDAYKEWAYSAKLEGYE